MGGLRGEAVALQPASFRSEEFDAIRHFCLFLAAFLSCKMLNHKPFLVLGRNESNYIGLKDQL